MKEEYFVVGGIWEDTTFAKLEDGKEVVQGPFSNLTSATMAWRGEAQKNVDNAHHRVFITSPVTDAETNKKILKVGNCILEV